ncbi:hypothetical protein Bca4012_089464 [Brassica carinata]|uniref:Uncharacterized protein n=1 Tax=Brassica carinata TaxID=52824 RepID=A0A8X7P9V5_BRACI|nr:hypothetical protein Bca52824_087018 [Brassica carinata]
MMNQALDASNQEAHMAQFRAEVADKEISRLRDELECSRRCEGELTAKEIRRACRRGKKEMVEVMKNHRAQLTSRGLSRVSRYRGRIVSHADS